MKPPQTAGPADHISTPQTHQQMTPPKWSAASLLHYEHNPPGAETSKPQPPKVLEAQSLQVPTPMTPFAQLTQSFPFGQTYLPPSIMVTGSIQVNCDHNLAVSERSTSHFQAGINRYSWNRDTIEYIHFNNPLGYLFLTNVGVFSQKWRIKGLAFYWGARSLFNISCITVSFIQFF